MVMGILNAELARFAFSTVVGAVVWILFTQATSLFKWESLSSRPLSNWDVLYLRNTFVSLVHGVIILGFSCYSLCTLPFDLNSVSAGFEQRFLLLTASYFSCDTLAMPLMLEHVSCWLYFHHAAMVVACAIAYVDGGFGRIVALSMFSGEISNPTMHARGIMRTLGLRYTWLFMINEDVFFAAFIVSRLVLMPGAMYLVSIEPIIPMAMTVVWGVPAVIGLYMGTLTIRKLFKKVEFYRQMRLGGSKVKLHWFQPNKEQAAVHRSKKGRDD